MEGSLECSLRRAKEQDERGTACQLIHKVDSSNYTSIWLRLNIAGARTTGRSNATITQQIRRSVAVTQTEYAEDRIRLATGDGFIKSAVQLDTRIWLSRVKSKANPGTLQYL